MYSEKTFENYIFWTKVKRIVLIIVLSALGAATGVLISMIYEAATQQTTLKPMIIAVSTIIMFAFSLLLTIGTSREVQDGYWKIAVLRKLTTIQKLLETNNELVTKNVNKSIISNSFSQKEKLSNKSKKEMRKKENNKKEEIQNDVVEVEIENDSVETTEDVEYEE